MRNQIAIAIALSLAGSLALAETSFESLDTDGNGKVTKDEYHGSVSDMGVFSDWDSNSDGNLGENEFNEIGFDHDFDTWDANNDSYLDSDEFYDGVFESYDANDDGYWESSEFDDVGDAGLFDV